MYSSLRAIGRRSGATRVGDLGPVLSLLGVVFAFVILDSVSDLWGTPWGRLLMAKVAIVSLAAVAGGYNHRVVIPALEGSSDNTDAIRRFRTIISVEAVLLIVVTVLTGLLIAASST